MGGKLGGAVCWSQTHLVIMARSDLIRHHLPYIVCFAPDDYTDWRQSGGGNYIKHEAIRPVSFSIVSQFLELVTSV